MRKNVFLVCIFLLSIKEKYAGVKNGLTSKVSSLKRVQTVYKHKDKPQVAKYVFI